MTVKTYKTTDPANKVNKELEDLQTFTVSMEHELDLINPYLIFTKSNYNMTANYYYLDKFNRYYFVTDFKVADGNRIFVNLQVDPLYTVREDLQECDITVIRNEQIKSNYIPDNKLPLFQDKFFLQAYDFKEIDPFPKNNNPGYVIGVF